MQITTTLRYCISSVRQAKMPQPDNTCWQSCRNRATHLLVVTHHPSIPCTAPQEEHLAMSKDAIAVLALWLGRPTFAWKLILKSLVSIHALHSGKSWWEMLQGHESGWQGQAPLGIFTPQEETMKSVYLVMEVTAPPTKYTYLQEKK